MNTRKMSVAIQMAKVSLLKGGFREWQVDKYQGWVESLRDIRQWRRMTRRVWKVSVR